MGQFLQYGENGQNVAFSYSFWSSAVTKQFDFSTFLNRSEDILTGAFVLVLAHLEPELELLEVWEMMVLQIIITIIANVITHATF